MVEQQNTTEQVIKHRVKKVLKLKTTVAQPTATETSLDSIPDEEFDKLARDLGYALPKKVAVAAEKQWREVSGDETKLPGMLIGYLHQADDIRQAYDKQQQAPDLLDKIISGSLLKDVAKELPDQTEPSTLEGHVTQTKYDRLEQALRKVQSQKDRLQQVCSELEKSFHATHKDFQESQKDLEELRKLYEALAQTESPKTLEDHVSKEEYEKLKESQALVERAFQIAQKNEKQLEDEVSTSNKKVKEYEDKISELKVHNADLSELFD